MNLYKAIIAALLFPYVIHAQGPVKVEVRFLDSAYTLVRGGVPYFVKGAGGSGNMARLAAYGGNSVRTWGTNGADKVLDSARKYGLTVLLGLDVSRERHGFDYDDTAAVRKQLDRLRNEVMKYRNHPALLAWGIGNELNLSYKNPKVWDAVNDISKMIHSLDPNHPTTTVLAGASKPVLTLLSERCRDIDFLSVNTYGDLPSLPGNLERSGWTGAYLVTEWGPTGHWESLQTAWKQPIEETSSEKAAVYKSRYEYAIERDRKKCMGSYVFLWGQKQERTPTWYGLFTEKGEESEVMDVMQYLWTNTWPKNRAPHLYSLQIDLKKAANNVYLLANQSYDVQVSATDPDGDALTYRWEVLPEPTTVSQGGDFEARSKPIEGKVSDSKGKVRLTAPDTEGAYRLFVYVSDGHNKVATANVPFFVKR